MRSTNSSFVTAVSNNQPVMTMPLKSGKMNDIHTEKVSLFYDGMQTHFFVKLNFNYGFFISEQISYLEEENQQLKAQLQLFQDQIASLKSENSQLKTILKEKRIEYTLKGTDEWEEKENSQVKE